MDFDGVIRLETSDHALWGMYKVDNASFMIPHMQRVVHLCKELDLKIVLSTAWRCDPIKSLQRDLEPTIPWDLLHEDYRTKVCGHRNDEVQEWLNRNDNPPYLILEDWDINFEKADSYMRDRIVWCTFKDGFTSERLEFAFAQWKRLYES